MDRPARTKKTVNYSDFMEDDDEDFATVKAPANKKARLSVKESHPEKTAKERTDTSGKGSKERVSLDEKNYNKDIEAALALSLLQTTENAEGSLTVNLDNERLPPVEDLPPVLTHFSMDSDCSDKALALPSEEGSPPVLSNCSVDVASLGLDKITSEQTLSPSACTKRKNQKAPKQQKQPNDSEEDDDYNPQNTPDSDSEFSDPGESEDEEYTVKKKGTNTKKGEKTTAPKVATKEKKAPKASKAKQSTGKSTALSKSPAIAQSLKSTPSTPPMTKSAQHSSPAGSRAPKWTPPGLVGRSGSSCQSPPLKSPGLGLRLGLSRLARVKPLHPNAVAH